MGDAARHVNPAQVFQDGIDGTPHMQQYRQLKFACDLELLDKVELLPDVIAIGDKTIQPYFTHGDRLFAAQGFAQHVQVCGQCAVNIHRMDAVSGAATGVLPAQRGNPVEIGPFHGWNHDVHNTDGMRTRHHGIAVGIKFCCVEVAVGID
ncbi:protein of unknown function [Georgfuchsia toluolica]|uniref:Uncharacterized protein n=1 Tax=Georgfuchsia toluolica TaxID=424218 RepID=A0A916J057_9PROT|nr:protein of unknown function [Georgfuchsia toluolica]